MEKEEKSIKNISEKNIDINDVQKILIALSKGDQKFLIDSLYKMNNEDFKYFRRISFSDNWNDNLPEMKKELSAYIQSNFSGPFKDLLSSIFKDPIEYDCEELFNAIDGPGTNEDTLIEILSTRTPEEIKEIKSRYRYSKSTLLDDIKDDTSGYFRDLLISLISSDRKDLTEEQFNQFSNLGYYLKEGHFYSNKEREDAYLNIFTKYSQGDLKKFVDPYRQQIKNFIDKNFSFNSRKLLKAIYYSVVDPHKFFAKKIHKALSGLFTVDYHLLNRVIATQRLKGLDFMERIKDSYKEFYGSNLIDDISLKLSGNYRKMIRRLLILN